MANHRVDEIGLTDPGPSNHQHHIPYAVLHGMNVPKNFINQEGSSAFDFGELEEAIVLQGLKLRHDEAKATQKIKRFEYVYKEASTIFDTVNDHTDARYLNALFTTGRPASATLDMFPSWPIRFQQTPRGSSKSGGENTTDSGSASKTENQIEPESPISKNPSSSSSSSDHHRQAFGHKLLQHLQQQQQLEMASDTSRTVITSQNQSAANQTPQEKLREQESHHFQQSTTLPRNFKRASTSEKQLDAKTLRRLAQNREAARKSRLRKKAYVQQLESSRMRLTQLEQDLQRARSQGVLLGGGTTGAVENVSPGAAICDMEYARWLEDDQRHMSELRTGLQANLSDSDLRIIVDSYISHYDEIFRLKGVAAKFDVFHLITGMWTTPAERCFLWMGGFRPSELIKMLISQLDPLTEQQLMGIYSLQHSSQQAEEALTQGLEQLQQSLIDIVAGGPVIDGTQQMAVALGKLANLEDFVRQADNLRQQTFHQLPRILTVRQAARCFLVIGEYYGRLRALSSLWASRPRHDDHSCQTTTDLQMVQPSSSHFSNFC